MTLREYAQKAFFVDLCKRANTEPTKRQASKFLNEKGLAYQQLLREDEGGES